MTKTKSVGGKEYPASVFAYVGNPDDPSTWHLPIPDEAHVRDALARFNQAQIPAADKAKVARKLVAAAKKHGIDASGFEKEYAVHESTNWQNVLEALTGELYEVCEAFPSYVIAEKDGELYRFGYSSENGKMIVEEPQPVTVAYVPVSESARFICEGSVEDDGYTWPVQIIQEGFAGGEVGGQAVPHYYSADTVRQFAEAANGARFGRKHPGPLEQEDDPARIAGYFSEGRVVGSAAHAKLHLLKSETALRDKLLAMKESGKNDLFGLSVLGYAEFKPGKVQGKSALISGKLAKLVSIDLVTEAGAGGKFLNSMRVAASSVSSMAEIDEMQKRAIKPTTTNNGSSNDAGRKGAHIVKPQIMKLLEKLRTRNAGRADELTTEFNGLKEEQQAEFLVKVSEAVAASVDHKNGEDVKEAQAILAQIKEAQTELKKIEAKNLIERKLADSKLPQPAIALVREHLKDQLVDEAAVDAEIKRTREAFAAYSTIGRVNAGGARVALESVDKVQMAMDALFGVKEAIKQCRESGVKPLRGIKEGYIVCTGDFDCTFQDGGFSRVTEAIATSNFPNILLNSMTKRLIQDYQEVGMGGLERLIVPANIADYKSNDRVRMGYLGDIPVVAENATYTELTYPTDEKISYVVQKRGGLITISDETIKNDDLGKIAAFPSRLARAARRTLKQFVTNFFATNPTYDPDSLALFVAGHNNLTVNPLSSANLDAAELLVMSQTEKDSGKPLNFPVQWLMVPLQLKATAMQINNNPTGTNNWYERFGTNHQAPENMIVNELLSSTTRWWVGCYPSEAPGLEIGYLDGIQEPQLFLASDPTVGLKFTNDQIVYKSKFVFGGKPIDFRPFVQNN